MKLQLRIIVDGFNSLRKLMETDLPPRKAYHLGRFVNKIESENKQFWRNSDLLIKKYGEKEKKKPGDKKNPGAEDNYFLRKGTPGFKKYEEEVEKIKDSEIEIPGFNKLELLESEIAGKKFSPVDMSFLSEFVILVFPELEKKDPDPENKSDQEKNPGKGKKKKKSQNP